MTSDQAIAMIGALGAAVLVGAAVKGRRLAATSLLKLALIWIGIIGLVWGAVVLASNVRAYFT